MKPSEEQHVRLEKAVCSPKRVQAGFTTELDALLPTILDGAFKGEMQSC